MRALGVRMRRLGYRVLPCKTPDHAERLLAARRDLAAALIPVALPTFDLGAALRFLRRQEPSGELTFVATGRRPEPEGRRLLREAGVELALWDPTDDHVLRFQINRALASSQIVLGGRSSLRAPAHWPLTVRSGQRRKPARLYSLSAQGAYLATSRPSMPGSTLTLDLPVSSGVAKIDGHVVMTNVPGHFLRDNLPLGMGVEFDGLEDKVATALAVWAAKRLGTLGF